MRALVKELAKGRDFVVEFENWDKLAEYMKKKGKDWCISFDEEYIEFAAKVVRGVDVDVILTLMDDIN